jgi:hypothetical protein
VAALKRALEVLPQLIKSNLISRFLQGVQRRLNHLHRELLKVLRPGVVVDSVQDKVVLTFHVAVHANPVQGRVSGKILLRNPWSKQGKVGIAAIFEWEVIDENDTNDIANICRVGVQHWLCWCRNGPFVS